jgi:hypothetical protein
MRRNRAHYNWGLWETDERGLWKWSISLYRSSTRETQREGSFTGGPWRIYKGSLWIWPSLSIEDPIRNLEGWFIYLGLRKAEKRAPETQHLYGGSARGTRKEGSFTGDPEGYIKEGSGMGVCLHRGHQWGTKGGHCFTWDSERKVRFWFIRRLGLLGNLGIWRKVC